jgi:predicted amidohydrolase
MILVPSMTESHAGLSRVRATAQARAVEHHAFVVISSTVGRPTDAWVHHGQAAVLAPSDGAFGEPLAQGPNHLPAIVYADLDLEHLRQSRVATGFWPARDARPDSVEVRSVEPDGP